MAGIRKITVILMSFGLAASGLSSATIAQADPPPKTASQLVESTLDSNTDLILPPGVDAPTSIEAPQVITDSQRSNAVASQEIECPLPAEGQSSSCVRPASPKKVAPRAVLPIPDYCAQAGVTNNYLGTRTQACGSFEYVMTVTRTQNGATTVTGTMNFVAVSYIYTDPSQTRFGNQVQFIASSITGDATGTVVKASTTCTQSCNQFSNNFQPQVMISGESKQGESYHDGTAITPGAVGNAFSQWSFEVKAPGVATGSLSTIPSVSVRCDNALPGNTRAGCVFAGINPGFGFNSTWGGFWTHLKNAQGSGLPGGSYNNTINRTTDPTLIAANRNKACPSKYPRPAGLSCDEYPFASTVQGGASGGGPRTFSGCQVDIGAPNSTGPTGFSVCMIDAYTNSQAGSVLGSLYNQSRVLNGDPFYVVPN